MRGLLVFFLVPLAASAQPWDQLARAAERIEARDLPVLFWAATAECDRLSDDMLRRQCLRIRLTRGVAATGKTYLLRGDAAALVAGEWDAAHAGVSLTIRGCLACAETIDVGGARRHVVTRGGVTVDGTEVVAAAVYRGIRRLDDEAAAKRWKTRVLPRLRLELIVRAPTKPELWTQGGRSGYFVELLGYRLYDPCDGTVLAAQPSAGTASVDGSTCEADLPGRAPMRVETNEPPFQLSPEDVRRVLKDVNPAVYQCYDSYGVPGRADVYIDIKNDGTVRFVEVRGAFADTPTGTCVGEAVKRARFPRFKRESIQIHYPYLLR